MIAYCTGNLLRSRGKPLIFAAIAALGLAADTIDNYNKKLLILMHTALQDLMNAVLEIIQNPRIFHFNSDIL